MGESAKHNDLFIWVPDGMEWELHNLLEDCEADYFDHMAEFEVQCWVADQMGIDPSRVEAMRE